MKDKISFDVSFSVEIKKYFINDIIDIGLSCGSIDYWCDQSELPSGDSIVDALLNGEKIKIRNDSEDEEYYLDIENLIEGIKLAVERGYLPLYGGEIDDDIDAEQADVIVQFALFGEIVYG